MTIQALTVDFHGTDLFVFDYNEQPYTPMKQIVEGMGLDWKTQYRKLSANKQRWGMVKMPIPSIGGLQDAVCMPLRKLTGWLSTISPNKVKPELKETIIKYQNECDDVLWEHWQQKHQLEIQQLPELPTISKTQQGILFNKVKNISAGSGKIRAEIWSRFQNKFNLSSYKELPLNQYDEAISYLDEKQSEYLGEGVEMLYVSNKELEKMLKGQLLTEPEYKALPQYINAEPVMDKNYNSAREYLNNILDWAKKTHNEGLFEDAKAIEYCLTQAWTTMDETLCRLEIGSGLLKRWRNK